MDKIKKLTIGAVLLVTLSCLFISVILYVEQVSASENTEGENVSEKQLVMKSYNELKEFYQDNAEYFGIPLTYFSDMNTEEEPYLAIVNIMGMDKDNLDMNELNQTILWITNSLKSYVELYGDDLLQFRDNAMACLDDKMSDEEKYLVIHDYVASHCSFNMEYKEEDNNSLLETTALGAVGQNEFVCLGYVNTYAYLIQNAFPEIYKNEDGSWKSIEEVNDSYIIDCGLVIGWEDDHYYNVLKLSDQWYYVDVCFDDITVQHHQKVRVETDGNCHHSLFMVSYEGFKKWLGLQCENLVDQYKDKCTDNSYENSWFSSVKSLIYYNEDYWFYVQSQVDLGEIEDKSKFVDKRDQIKVRDRATGKVRVLIDFESGSSYSMDGVEKKVNEELKAEYEQVLLYNKMYPGMQHCIGLYGDELYFNNSNKIYTYNLNDYSISKIKEYNEVPVLIQSGESGCPGKQFYVAEKESENISFKITNHPIVGIAVKNDKKLYVAIATNYSNSTEPAYSKEEINYRINYNRFGECITIGEGFQWCANVKDALELTCLTSDEHQYQRVIVAPGCLQEGFSELRCVDCGKNTGEKTDIVENLGHHYVYNDEEGMYVCTRCNYAEMGVFEHNYEEPVFFGKIMEDAYTCHALFKCKTCENEQTVICGDVNVDVKKEATCLEEGYVLYTSYCIFQDQQYTYSDKRKIDAKGHNYIGPQFKWSEDCEKCTMYFYCNTCQKNNQEGKIVNCVVESHILEPTFAKEGSKRCIARGSFLGTEYTAVYETILPPLDANTTLVKNAYTLYATQKVDVLFKSDDVEECIVEAYSLDPDIAKVTSKGRISGISAGKTTVVVKIKNGKLFEIPVTVKKPKVTLTATSIPLQLKKATKVVKIKSKIASDRIVKWTVSNKKILSVNSSGVIKGKKVGKAVVTVIMKSGATAKCTVKVQKSAVKTKKITVNASKVNLYLRKNKNTYTLKVTKNPITSLEKVTFKSSNKKIVTVSSSGKLKAKKKGTAYITIKVGKVSKKIRVVVRK